MIGDVDVQILAESVAESAGTGLDSRVGQRLLAMSLADGVGSDICRGFFLESKRNREGKKKEAYMCQLFSRI